MASEQAKAGGVVVPRGNLISNSIAELKKVSFPTRQETMQATIVTLFIVFFVAICLFVLDQIFFQLMSAILK